MTNVEFQFPAVMDAFNEAQNDVSSEGGMYADVLETIETSKDAIFKLSNSCSQMVLNVQYANDLREKTRAGVEQRNKESRIVFLEQKAREAEVKLTEINSKWGCISRSNDSVDIFSACESQKSQFTDVINCKNDIIKTLKNELAKADEKFVKDQQHHRNDVNVLANRIDEHIETMRNAYRRHLNLIEEVVGKERKILLYQKQKEWTDLNVKFTEEKTNASNDISKMVEEYDKSVNDMMWDHDETYRVTKKNLESDIQKLYIQLQETKATCLLNERKLEYNYLILTKRREDLNRIKAKQRQRINRLRDILVEIENEKVECAAWHSSEVSKLSKCVSEMKSNMTHLSHKITRTAAINENTYKKVWSLNDKRATTLLEEILSIDKRFHEQELRIKWTSPNVTRPKMYELPSVKFALRHVPDFRKHNSAEVHLGDTSKNVVSESLPPADLPLIKFILLNIVEHMKFTISDQIYSLTKDLSNEKQAVVLFDNVLRVLNVEDLAELNFMTSHFSPFIICSTCKTKQKSQKLPVIFSSNYQKSLVSSKRTGSGNKYGKKPYVKRPFSSRVASEEEIVSQHTDTDHVICKNPEHLWYIDEFSVIQALADFVQEKVYRQRRETEIEPPRKTSLIRVLSDRDVELYWHSFRFKFIEERKNLWSMIFSYWTNYYRLLKEQIDLELLVKRAERLNSEFKRALNGFTGKNDSE